MHKGTVYIIHGWSSYPEEAWLPWFKNEVEKLGFKAVVPMMPDTDEPKIETWVPYLKSIIKELDRNTFFVGHSIGCQTILRYLNDLKPIDKKIGGAIFVAGWFFLKDLTSEKEWEIVAPWIPKELFKLSANELKQQWNIAKEWMNETIDFKKIKNHTDNFAAIFSDNDPYVPIENSEIFAKELGAEVFIEHDKGHFTEDNDVNELPVLLEEFKHMYKFRNFRLKDLI